MPRRARSKSGTGVYHIILRGNGKQILFEDDADHRFFIARMSRFCAETGVTCIAYCLMENHIHLLLRDPDDQLDLFAKKIGVSYAQHFNKKYDRTGHLFEDRYRSEPIEDEPYLMVCYRYILKNPQKAGICAAKLYLWNSYRDYAAEEPEYSDPSMMRDLIGNVQSFEHFMQGGDEDKCLEYDYTAYVDRENAKILLYLRQCTGSEDPTILQKMDKSERNRILRSLIDAGYTRPRIERVTGISRGILQRL